tara:strand:- start:1255 stop:1995 length:741 start_codon:yes stop_codon:yes gene_type:complete
MSDKIDKSVFDKMISASADKTGVSNLFGEEGSRITKDTVHDALMAAGFTPGLGNIADAVDAVLYAFEGEFGSAAISAAAMIPYIGQTVSAKKALKVAKDSGEEMVTFYRGVDSWKKSRHALRHSAKPGVKIVDTGKTMIKDGKFIGGGQWVNPNKLNVMYTKLGEEVKFTKDAIWVSEDVNVAKRYLRNKKGSTEKGYLLKFEVPKSFVDRYFVKTAQTQNQAAGLFGDGLPKTFLTKVTKGEDLY